MAENETKPIGLYIGAHICGNSLYREYLPSVFNLSTLGLQYFKVNSISTVKKIFRPGELFMRFGYEDGPTGAQEGKKMVGLNKKSLKDLGKRLKFFRQLVEKSRSEMASDLKKPLFHVTAIEKGKIFPDLDDFVMLYSGFGMNTGWLITGKQGIFIYKGEKTPAHAYLMGTMTPYNGHEPETRQFGQFFKSMRNPGNRKQILAEVEEVMEKIQGIFNEKDRPNE